MIMKHSSKTKENKNIKKKEEKNHLNAMMGLIYEQCKENYEYILLINEMYVFKV